jgi:hypothetical protein
MSLIQYQQDRREISPVTLLLLFANALFACVCVFQWAYVSMYVAAPVNWAAQSTLRATPELFDYPFGVLWAMPFTAAVIARLAHSFGAFRTSYMVALFPMLYFAFVFGVYYLAPLHWR